MNTPKPQRWHKGASRVFAAVVAVSLSTACATETFNGPVVVAPPLETYSVAFHTQLLEDLYALPIPDCDPLMDFEHVGTCSALGRIARDYLRLRDQIRATENDQ